MAMHSHLSLMENAPHRPDLAWAMQPAHLCIGAMHPGVVCLVQSLASGPHHLGWVKSCWALCGGAQVGAATCLPCTCPPAAPAAAGNKAMAWLHGITANDVVLCDLCSVHAEQMWTSYVLALFT